MSTLSISDIENELTSSVSQIEKLTGQKVTLFRAPFGDYDNEVIETAQKLGLYTIQWDVDSLDWKNLSANEIKKRVVSKVKSGSIVLFHNQGLHTAKALIEIIKSLKEKGYTFVPIGELIYRDNYQMAVDGAQVLSI
jgi:peptidoglycan/xylan/chitin deacetylase (PgdA/CDA1 family)